MAPSPRSSSSIWQKKNKSKGLEVRNDLLDIEGKTGRFFYFSFGICDEQNKKLRSQTKQVTVAECPNMLL